MTDRETNRDISKAGASARKSPARMEIRAIVVVGTHLARLEQISSELAQMRAMLYAPPERDASKGDDTIDAYLYRRFETSPISEQLAQLADGSPETERLLIALARIHDRAAIHAEVCTRFDEAWAARIAKLSPAAVADLTIAEEANAWAVSLTQWFGSLLANPPGLGPWSSSAIPGLEVFADRPRKP